jgi:hypothetical protein
MLARVVVVLLTFEPHDDGEKSKSSRGSALLLKTVGQAVDAPAGRALALAAADAWLWTFTWSRAADGPKVRALAPPPGELAAPGELADMFSDHAPRAEWLDGAAITRDSIDYPG